MSDRICIRTCKRRGEHYATCVDYGKPPADAECKGCAPRECRDGALICDACFGRMRSLLGDLPDLLGRLRSLADPRKATPMDQERVASSSTEPPAPVGADLLDAIHAIGMVEDWAYADLAASTNDAEAMTWLSATVLDRHPEKDGIREGWSVQDAVDKWGVERRTDFTFVYPDDHVDEVVLGPVREWFDPLLTLEQAAKRADVSQRQVQRWVRNEILPVVAKHRGPRGSVLKYVHASAVDVAANVAKANQEGSRFAVTKGTSNEP